MIREYVYNTVGREHTSPNNDAMRRLHRRINHNNGILNTSRSSNHSSSLRIRRTELSGSRNHASRDKQESSNYNSGLESQDPIDQRQYIKKIGSNLSSGRRKFNYQPTNRINIVKSSDKNYVENHYMLTNKLQSQQRHLQKRQYQKGSQNFVRRNQNQKARSNYLGQVYSQNGRTGRNENRQYSKESVNDSQRRSSKGSRIIQRHSRDRNKVSVQKNEEIPLRNYRVQNKNRIRKHNEEGEIKKLQQKYFQNIYQLKSPTNKVKDQRKQYYQQPKEHNNHNNKNNKNFNTYYFKPEHTSTSGGTTEVAKTNADFSKVGPISETSLPVFSAASHKIVRSKQSEPTSTNKKHLLKLDKAKNDPKKRNKDKQVQRKKEQQQDFSSITVRLKQKNIKLQQRFQKQPLRKERIIQPKDDPTPMGNVFLPVQSKRFEKTNEWAQDILERVILHLECLNAIADYTKQFRRLYENEQPWEALIFLSYKKFYIERIKVYLVFSDRKAKEYDNQLKIQNPFILPYSKISDKEIAKFIQTKECQALRYELQSQNTKIRTALRNLYNLYIEKSGDFVNMLDCDNFSEEVYKYMLEQLEGISQNLEEQGLIEPTKLRMGKIIKTGLIIGYLNGKYIKNFAQMLLHEDTVKIGKRQKIREDCIADLFMAQFKRALF